MENATAVWRDVVYLYIASNSALKWSVPNSYFQLRLAPISSDYFRLYTSWSVSIRIATTILRRMAMLGEIWRSLSELSRARWSSTEFDVAQRGLMELKNRHGFTKLSSYFAELGKAKLISKELNRARWNPVELGGAKKSSSELSGAQHSTGELGGPRHLLLRRTASIRSLAIWCFFCTSLFIMLHFFLHH